MSVGRAQDILIGPRTTVYGLLQAYPFLETFLLARVRGFEALRDERARTRWARVMTLDDVGLRLNLPWQQLVREIAAEVERETGRQPRVADAPRRIVDDERRLGELRDIVDGLEAGGPLLEMAARWRAATGDLEQAETAALDAALSEAAVAGRAAADRAVAAAAASGDGALAPPPAGHPLDTLRREARHVRQLSAGLKAELDRLGGSPPRRRWQREKPLVARLVERLSAVELRFRREQQAWFPALEVHGGRRPAGPARGPSDGGAGDAAPPAPRRRAGRRRLRRGGRGAAGRRPRGPARAGRAAARAAGDAALLRRRLGGGARARGRGGLGAHPAAARLARFLTSGGFGERRTGHTACHGCADISETHFSRRRT